MKLVLFMCVLLISTHIGAKAPEIYRCIQKDGSVVIQDRRCLVTDLQQAKPPKPAKRALSERALLNNKAQSSPSTQPRKQANSPLQIDQAKGSQKTTRSPYFVFGWDRFIPANWLVHKINTNKYQQLLLSRSQFKTPHDFTQGVKLLVYSDTMQASRLGAFAQALQLYHQIRDNSNLLLLDSQFKTHPNYKVFNIKYQNQRKQLMLTEFYIDEDNNDLFVLTVQADQSEWLANWQLAEKIISQL